MKHAFLLILALGVWIVAPAPLVAGPADAQAAFARCNRLRDAGEKPVAVQCYVDGYRAWKNAKFLINEASLLGDMGRKVEAAEIYDGLLDADDEAVRQSASEGLATLAPQL